MVNNSNQERTTKKQKLTPKTLECIKILKELGKFKKGKTTKLEAIKTLESLNYQWDNDSQVWYNKNLQTTVLVRTDSMVIEDFMEYLLNCINEYDGSDFELKNNLLIYQAKDSKKEVIEGMKQCFLVFNNNSQDEVLDDDFLDDEVLDDEILENE